MGIVDVYATVPILFLARKQYNYTYRKSEYQQPWILRR